MLNLSHKEWVGFYQYVTKQKLLDLEISFLEMINYTITNQHNRIGEEEYKRHKLSRRSLNRVQKYYEVFSFVRRIMTNSFLQLLTDLSIQEYQAFKGYIKNRRLLPSREFVLKRVWKYVEELQAGGEEVCAYKYLHPNSFKNDKNKVYDKGTIDNALSDCNKYLQEYLVYSTLEQKGVQRQLLLLEGYRRANLYKAWKREHRKITESQQLIEETNWEYYWNQFALADAQFQYIVATRDQYVNLSPKEMVAYWDVQYITKKLILLCASYVFDAQAATKTPHYISFDLLETVLKARYGDWEKFPLIQAYYLLFKLLQTEEIFYFHSLIQLLNQHTKGRVKEEENSQIGFAEFDQRQITYILIWYYRKQAKRGEKKMLDEALVMTKTMLEQGFLYVDGLLQTNNFLLILHLALKTKRLDWAVEFVNVYGKSLPPKKRESYSTYATLLIKFEKKEYTYVLKELAIKGDDAFMKQDEFLLIYRRLLRLKCEYELEYPKGGDTYSTDLTRHKTERLLYMDLEATSKWCKRRLEEESFKTKAYATKFQNFISVLRVFQRTDVYFRDRLKHIYEATSISTPIEEGDEANIVLLPFDVFIRGILNGQGVAKLLDSDWLLEKYRTRMDWIERNEKGT